MSGSRQHFSRKRLRLSLDSSELQTEMYLLNQAAAILIYGTALDLVDTRRLVLQQAGFAVTVSSELERTIELLAARPFDLFLLCHSLSAFECEQALVQAHALRPTGKNLVLCKALSNRPEGRGDVHLEMLVSPQMLIDTARALTAGVGEGSRGGEEASRRSAAAQPLGI